MTERLEQRYCIKFCQKLGDSQVETIRKIHTVFGDDAMGITQIKEWYNRFKDGRTSVESEPRPGRPSTCRNDQVIAKVNAVVMRDRRLTIREIAEEVGLSTFSAHSIVTEDLAMKRVSAKFVPKLLTAEQKQLRVEVSQDMLDSTNSDPDFLNTIITGDESWVYGYDPETKSQSSQWKHSSSPRPKKARQVRSNVKVMLTAFFDSRGVVHHEYAPQGQTINKEYYRDVLRRLRDAVRRKRQDLWSTGNWRLHHDNAPAHSSHLIQTFLAKNQTPVLQQAPYSPDMAPCDFWLFRKLKRPLKGTRFQTREDIMAATTAELNSIPKEAFSACFQQWRHRWEKCVESQGNYFEGD
jgi:histone-lysine N-methyltransferase SETMAR